MPEPARPAVRRSPRSSTIASASSKIGGRLVDNTVRFDRGIHRRNAAGRRHDRRARETRVARMTTAAFERSFDSIREIFAMTADIFAREGIDPRLLPTVDLAL